ncbi:MAG: hypothetical protein ABSH53_13085 [Holophaga sp.]|jgi:hypothetical protein
MSPDPQVPSLAPRTRPRPADWQPLEGIQGYTLATQGKVWKGRKGWWASRKGQAAIQGPFRGYRQAQAWVEEPLAQAKQERAAGRAVKAEQASRDRAEQVEAMAVRTWGDLPAGERSLQPGQVWTHKVRAQREAMILEVRKDTVVGLFKSDAGLAWKEAARETKDVRGFLKVYRFKGHETPKARGRKA